MTLTRTRTLCAALLLALGSLAAPAAAQQAVLPLDDIAYTYIDALQVRGLLTDLPLIERPYSVGAVRAAVAAARTTVRDAGTARWLAAIAKAADKYAPGVTAADSGVLAASLAGYAVAQTSGTRDLMQSSRTNSVGPGFTLRTLLQSGPFTGALRVIGDRRMRSDPEYLGRRDRVIASRTEDAYLGYATRHVTLQAGRVGRSWALPGHLGLMVSNGAYTYDHLYLRAGGDRVHLSSVIARLDDERLNFVTDTLGQRYFMAHRLGVTIGGVEAGLSESIVYGGVGAGAKPALLNPLAPVFLTQYSDGEQANMAFGADVLWRTRRGTMLGAQLYVDDFQIDRCDLCGEPPGLGLTLMTDGVPLAGGARAFASYTRVTSLTYRTASRVERYTYRSVGLGQRNSDFDELKAGVDVGPMLPLPLRAYVAYRRQGAGDYREPFPPESQRSGWPLIFEGVVVKTFRVAATTALRVGDGVELSADAGVNHSSNDLRVRGATTTRFEGRLRVALEPSWARLRTGLFGK